MRATHVAMLSPLRKKIVNTALRQATSSRVGRAVEAVGFGVSVIASASSSSAGVLGSNRFDRSDVEHYRSVATDRNAVRVRAADPRVSAHCRPMDQRLHRSGSHAIFALAKRLTPRSRPIRSPQQPGYSQRENHAPYHHRPHRRGPRRVRGRTARLQRMLVGRRHGIVRRRHDHLRHLGPEPAARPCRRSPTSSPREHPNITVKIQVTPYKEYFTKLQTAVRAARPPTCSG